VAQTRRVILIDDLDGSEATQTMRFALDGVAYELELNDRNAAAMRESLQRYVAASRPVGTRLLAPGEVRHVSVGYDPKAVRAWASSWKVKIPSRGRIPQSVVDEYHAAGN
jgi:allantoicase